MLVVMEVWNGACSFRNYFLGNESNKRLNHLNHEQISFPKRLMCVDEGKCFKLLSGKTALKVSILANSEGIRGTVGHMLGEYLNYCRPACDS